MSFTSMLTPVSTRPVEDFIARAVDAVTVFAKNKSLGCSAEMHSNMATSMDDGFVLIIFSLTTPLGQTQNANLQIKVSALTGEPRVHTSSGFPDSFEPLLRDLPALAAGWQNSKGAQAVVQNNSAKGRGRKAVVAQPVKASGQDPIKTIAEASVTLIDLATVQAELKKTERPRRYIGASGIGDPMHSVPSVEHAWVSIEHA